MKPAEVALPEFRSFPQTAVAPALAPSSREVRSFPEVPRPESSHRRELRTDREFRVPVAFETEAFEVPIYLRNLGLAMACEAEEFSARRGNLLMTCRLTETEIIAVSTSALS